MTTILEAAISIPEELLEQIERGNVLLFIGERINHHSKSQAFLDQVIKELAARCGMTYQGELSFPEVAQAYEDDKGRHALVQFIRDQWGELSDRPEVAHRLIAGLTNCTVFVTTCFDRKLEQALEEAERAVDVIVGKVDIAFEDERKTQLYKLRGSIDQVDSLVLTEDDYEIFFKDQANMSVVLQGYLVRKTILFIGYDLSDPNFKRLYHEIIASLDNYARRAYAIEKGLPDQMSRWCKRRGIEVIEADITTFLEALTTQLSTRISPIPATLPQSVQESTVPLPKRPYKLLDYYEAKDAAIFFGRRQETQLLSSLIHAHRLVLLYGASGVGKTSILLAGAGPRLEQVEPPYEMIYIRALEDPSLIIRQAVKRRLPEARLSEDGRLVDFLDIATEALGRTLVIVLDQFEEFFIRLSPQFRAVFISELGLLYDAHDVPVKIVLSLREDWLASISEIEMRIPEVFRTKMRLLTLTREQARQAITAPVEQLGVSYESILVERLLDDLVGNEGTMVLPPQLQLVCSKLYDQLDPASQRIALEEYKRLGGARGILQQYLNDELARLAHSERILAQAILEELVTSQGTKAVKTASELNLALYPDRPKVEEILEKLVRARLLRALEREDGRVAYELAHEYLIREIDIGIEAQARKQVEELLKQETENWQRFGTLMGVDKLNLVDRVRETLQLNPQAQELLLRSTLQVGHQVDYWLTRVVDLEQRMLILVEAISNQQAEVRQQALLALGQTLVTNPEIATLKVAATLAECLLDQDSNLRTMAMDLLKQQNIAANPKMALSEVSQTLAKMLSDKSWDIRDRAAEALGQIVVVNPHMVTEPLTEILLEHLQEEEGGVRARAAIVLGNLMATVPASVPKIITHLTGQLSSSNIKLRAKAMEAIEQIGMIRPEFISLMANSLKALLSDTNEDVRIRVTKALASWKSSDLILEQDNKL